MKNLILGMLTLLTAMLFSCNPVHAQTGVPLYATSSVIGSIDSMKTTQAFDTVTNTNSKYLVSKAGAFASSDNGSYTLSFYVKSLSGTPATVRFIWQGSFNGYDWFRMTNNYGTDGLNCDTLNVTPTTTATQYKYVSRPGTAKFITGYSTVAVQNQGCRVPYQRLWITSTGTQSTRVYSPSIFTFKN